MIFDEKSEILLQTGSSCVWVTISDRDSGSKLNQSVFDKKSEKLPLTGSNCISVTVDDLDSAVKLKCSFFDDFSTKSLKYYSRPEVAVSG